MSTLPLAEVKSHLSELVSRVASQHDRVTVTVHGRPSAVLLAVEDLEALEETIAVLSDQDALGQIAASERELARGEGEPEEQRPRRCGAGGRRGDVMARRPASRRRCSTHSRRRERQLAYASDCRATCDGSLFMARLNTRRAAKSVTRSSNPASPGPT